MTRDHRRQDELTADTIHVPCPVEGCGAGVDEQCVNLRQGGTSRLPHVLRIRAANQAEEST